MDGWVDRMVRTRRGRRSGRGRRRSVPRYDSTTSGSVRTSSGGPSAITRPWSMATRRSDTDETSGMSCSITSSAAPRPSRIWSSSGPERLGLALGDAARGLVEQDHRRPVGDDAGEVDDAARAGGQLAEELGAERAEAQQLDELVDALGDLLLGVEGVRAGAARRSPGPSMLTKRSRLTASASSTVMAGNRRASWNERPRPRWARWFGGSPVMSWPARRIRPLSAGVKPGDHVEERGLAGAVGTDDPDDLAGRDARSETSSTARMPAEGPGERRRSAAPAPPTARRLDAAVARPPWRAPARAGVAAVPVARPGAFEEHRAQEVGPLEQLGGGARRTGSRPSP